MPVYMAVSTLRQVVVEQLNIHVEDLEKTTLFYLDLLIINGILLYKEALTCVRKNGTYDTLDCRKCLIELPSCQESHYHRTQIESDNHDLYLVRVRVVVVVRGPARCAYLFINSRSIDIRLM